VKERGHWFGLENYLPTPIVNTDDGGAKKGNVMMMKKQSNKKRKEC